MATLPRNSTLNYTNYFLTNISMHILVIVPTHGNPKANLLFVQLPDEQNKLDLSQKSKAGETEDSQCDHFHSPWMCLDYFGLVFFVYFDASFTIRVQILNSYVLCMFHQILKWVVLFSLFTEMCCFLPVLPELSQSVLVKGLGCFSLTAAVCSVNWTHLLLITLITFFTQFPSLLQSHGSWFFYLVFVGVPSTTLLCNWRVPYYWFASNNLS